MAPIEIGDQRPEIDPKHLGETSRKCETGAAFPAKDHPDMAAGDAECAGQLPKSQAVDVSPIAESSRGNDDQSGVGTR